MFDIDGDTNYSCMFTISCTGFKMASSFANICRNLAEKKNLENFSIQFSRESDKGF